MRKFLPILFSLVANLFFSVPSFGTVTNTTSSVSYVGNGSLAIYSYPYRIFASTDLIVTTASSSATTTLGLGSDYTVSGVLNYNGGNVTLVAGNLASGTTITINRIEPLTQLTSFRNQGSFIPAKHEDAYDKLTMMVQQQQNQINIINAQTTPKPIYTATAVPTSTPTSTPLVYIPNSPATFVGGSFKGPGPTFTPTSSFTPQVIAVNDGLENTSAGLGAGASISSGFENNYIGWNSGNRETTSGGNAFYGAHTGEVATSNGGSLFGAAAGQALTSGAFNSLGGQDTGKSITTHSNNSGWGAFSLYNCDSDNNSSYGFQNLYSLTSGTENTGAGLNGLYSLTTGSYNTAIGRSADGFGVTVSHSVFLGAYAGQYNLLSNVFYVDSFDRGNTANDQTEALLYGIFDASPSNQILNINASVSIAGNVNANTYSVGATPTPGISFAITVLNNSAIPTPVILNFNSGILTKHTP